VGKAATNCTNWTNLRKKGVYPGGWGGNGHELHELDELGKEVVQPGRCGEDGHELDELGKEAVQPGGWGEDGHELHELDEFQGEQPRIVRMERRWLSTSRRVGEKDNLWGQPELVGLTRYCFWI
jgi:hypothetical protein